VSAQASVAAAKLGEPSLARRERRPVSLRGVAVREDGSSVEVLLLDLSYEGCRLESPVAFNPNEILKLAVLGRGGIDARVRWWRGGRAGLIFESEKTLQKRYWPRQSDRKSLSAEVSLRRLGKLNYRARVFDLSPEGCKVELVDRPELREHVLIKFDGLESLEAEVCWIDGSSAGLRFERTIHSAVFDLLLQRLG
jgi:hypothetical protein